MKILLETLNISLMKMQILTTSLKQDSRKKFMKNRKAVLEERPAEKIQKLNIQEDF